MRRTLRALALCICGTMIVPLIQSAFARQQPATIDFKRDIKPILAANCLSCHGAQRAMGQLRLDDKQLALKGGVSGPVINPGHSDDSRLIKRILGLGDEPQMPLDKDPLTPAQIALLRSWIDQGAVWPEEAADTKNVKGEHWAFVAPTRPAVPTVRQKTWVRNPIDQFVLAEIEGHGLAPSQEADRSTLIRRVKLDLTGLPPTPSEVDEFLRDRSPDAYEKLVERLLASPHYGERWGRWWLDAARYADTNGFEKDRPRSIWPYRDWVINAFNRDLPFDKFTIEQLAGDLLPGSTLDQRIATGFLRNSMLNEEGGVDPEQFRIEGIIDRVDAVGKAFLGLTVNCAQCHTHKFDPITQTEYYRFFAFLNSDQEVELEVPDAALREKRAEIEGKIARIEDELMSRNPDWAQRMGQWEAAASSNQGEWTVLKDAEIFAAFGVKFERVEDGSFIPRGDNSTSNNYQVVARTDLKNITGFRLELLTDPSLPRSGPGRANDGSLFVSEFSVEAAPVDQPSAATKVALVSSSADFERTDFPVKNAIDGNVKTHWSSDAGPGRRNQDRNLVFVAQTPVTFPSAAKLTFQIVQKADENIDLAGGKPNIGRFRLSVTSAKDPKAEMFPSSVRRILAIPAARRTKEEARQLFGVFRTTVPEFADANRRIDEVMKDWPYGPTTLALMPRTPLRETHLFRRGDWKRPGDVVQPGTPAFLNPFPADLPRTRLGLAKWIIDGKNPLASRVIVNRIWQQYFGTGLVTTPEDFGMRSEKPSHPALLDWLACEFREKGWSWKNIQRLIVTSATYRQSSVVTPRLREADPSNRLLARAPRLRVDAEIVRDVALAASGLLSPKIGGPSVYPPIPEGVLNLGYGRPMDWPVSTGEDRHRRGMYTFWKRSVPYPSLLVFDSPNGDLACTRRIRSNTPLQALTTLNDAVFVEAAQAMALRIWREGGAEDRSRMIYAFRLCMGRRPDLVELRELLAFLHGQHANFDGRTSAAVYVSASDLNNLPADVDLHRIAPWVMVSRLLLNLDETMTRE